VTTTIGTAGAPDQVWTRAEGGTTPPAPAPTTRAEGDPPAPADPAAEGMTLEQVVAALQAIVEQAQQGNRALTDAEVERYEALERRLNTVRSSDQVLLRHRAHTAVTATPVIPGSMSTKEDTTLERAFDAYMRTGHENSDMVELRTQSVGTNTAGGFTVPEIMRQKLVERMKAFGGMAQFAEEINTSGGEPMTWPTLDDTANSGVRVAEGVAPASGGADLVFGEATLGSFDYQAPGAGNNPLEVTLNLLQDSAFDIQGLVRRKLGERIGRIQALDWTNGPGGTDGPDGIMAKATGPTYTATGAAPTYADVIGAIHSVDPAYRDSGNCRFIMNDATWAMFEGMLDGNDRPLITQSTDSITGKPQYSLRGYPVAIDQGFDTYADGAAHVWGVFGDIREAYVIRRVRDLDLIVDPYTAAHQRKVKYTLWARADGTIQNAFAVSTLKNAA